MPKKAFSLAALTTLLLAASACGRSTEQNTAADKGKGFAATVTAVADGDTVRATDSNGRKLKIRMAYIDAPETSQAHGQASRDALKKRLERKNVRVEIFDTDQYQRHVARIYLDGKDINLEQIELGNAWHYRSIARKNQNKADYAAYEAAEQQAKSSRSGLWKQSNPQAPWAYRHQQRGGGQ